MKLLKQIWDGFQKIGKAIGETITSIVLLVFYFVVFLLFAVPFQLANKIFGVKGNGNWKARDKQDLTLKDLANE